MLEVQLWTLGIWTWGASFRTFGVRGLDVWKLPKLDENFNIFDLRDLDWQRNVGV